MGAQSWPNPTEARRVARNKKAHSNWNMGAILEGDRSGFARCGPKERLAKGMILRAGEGNYDWIHGILRDDLASADVADAKGYTALAAAAVSPHAGYPGLWTLPCAGPLSSQPIGAMHRVRLWRSWGALIFPRRRLRVDASAGLAHTPVVLTRLSSSLQVHCRNNIVNLLLDSGADVNKLTDEGLTALSMCLLLYYPSGCFQPNIAERTVPKPQVSPSAPWPSLVSAAPGPPPLSPTPHPPAICPGSGPPASPSSCRSASAGAKGH